MSLLILEIVPYLAFAGAGFLLAWVGADIALTKLRKSRAPGQPKQESVRGLAGDPEPMEEPTTAAANVLEEDDASDEVEEESPELPSSQAVNVAKPAEESDNVASDREDDAVEVKAESDEEEGTETGEDLVHSSRVVQRDPSVRVFDMSVAPSSRKVPATED